MKFLYIFILVFSLSIGIYLLSQKPKEYIHIAVSSWPGYTPIYYAEEKGWLDETDIEILHVATLEESLNIYKLGLCDGLATTNDIAVKLQEQYQVMPVMVSDRSNGGDKVLSNISLEKIKAMKSNIDVFLELDSVNHLVFDGFVQYYDLNRSHYTLYNMNQSLLGEMEMSDKPTLLITYEPFSTMLIKQGYQEIASSKLSTINIFDLLMVKESVYQNNQDSFKQLRELVYKAIQHLENDPYEFYQTVQHYLERQSFEEFLKALEEISLVKTQEDENFYLEIYTKQTQEKKQ